MSSVVSPSATHNLRVAPPLHPSSCCVAFGDAYLWVADPRQVTLDSDHPWPSPFGQLSAVQIRSHRICLCPDKDNFAGSKIERASARPQGPRQGRRGPKVTKRNPPRSLRRANFARSPARLAAVERSPNSPGAIQRASGSIRSLATTPGLARCSAHSDGGLSKPLQTIPPEVFSTPRMARANLASRGPSARRGARGIARMARRHRDVPSGHRRARGARRRGVSRHSGGLLFGYFLLAGQEKVTRGCRGRSTPRFSIQASPQATQCQKPPFGGF